MRSIKNLSTKRIVWFILISPLLLIQFFILAPIGFICGLINEFCNSTINKLWDIEENYILKFTKKENNDNINSLNGNINKLIIFLLP